MAMTACFGSFSASAQTVVELFTAQGCPACPAADASLAKLARRADVLALTLPVTYWDVRGWADPLAQAAFTERQRRYAAIGRREVATPQFVINGWLATNDSDPLALERAIRAAARVGGPMIWSDGRFLTVGADRRTKRATTVWLADFEVRPTITSIRAGETRGRTAVQHHVVRDLFVIGRWTGDHMRSLLPQLAAGRRRAAIVQSADGGAIIAAAVLR